jgi:hypothetical protein
VNSAEVKIQAATAHLLGTDSRYQVAVSKHLTGALLAARNGAAQRAAAAAGKKWLSGLGTSTVLAALAQVARQRISEPESGQPGAGGQKERPVEPKIQVAVTQLLGANSAYHRSLVQKLTSDLLRTCETAALRAAVAAEKKWLSALGPNMVVASLAEVAKPRRSNPERTAPTQAGQNQESQ